MIVIVPFMLEWMEQWNGNVPATENTRLLDWPPPIALDIPHDSSSSSTPWGTESPFVQVMTSPTPAATVAGIQVLLSTDAVTSVGSAESVHGGFPAVVATGPLVPLGGVVAPCGVAPCGVVAPGAVGAPVPGPPVHAASTSAMPMAPARRRMGRMSILHVGRDCARHDSAAGSSSSYGSTVGGDRLLDPDLARQLVLHEARAQQTPARELRDLGDSWLFHDPGDAEPFWNRLIAPRWPADSAAFDRRLDEVTTLFATLARLPHVRPLPLGGTPVDLAARLEAAGFVTVGADLRMALLAPFTATELALNARAQADETFGAGSVDVSRHEAGTTLGPGGGRWADRRRWAGDASLVLAEAFGVEDARRTALENDLLACVSRPGCAIVLIRIDGEPAAIARRATTPEGTYLSSIGTRPRFRRQGLGSLATALALADAGEARSPVVHLAVEVDNERARRLYANLGFHVVGEPAPDLLLR